MYAHDLNFYDFVVSWNGFTGSRYTAAVHRRCIYLQVFRALKKGFLELTPNEKVLLVLTASIFLTVYAEMLALLLLPFYIAATKQSFVFFRRKQDLFCLLYTSDAADEGCAV